MLRFLIEIAMLLRNTLLVMATLGVTLLLGNVVTLPEWLMPLSLLPAGLMFLRLANKKLPPLVENRRVCCRSVGDAVPLQSAAFVR